MLASRGGEASKRQPGTMNLRQILRTGLTASAITHASALTLVLWLAEAHPFGSVPTDDLPKLTAMWGEELNRQASMISYLNDFRVLAISTLIFIPLLFFMRRQAGFARPSRR